MVKLYTDCKTDAERASFFKSGRGWESGVVAKSLEGDLADVFAFRAAVTKAMAELRESFVADARLAPEYERGWNDGIQRAVDILAKLGLEEAK